MFGVNNIIKFVSTLLLCAKEWETVYLSILSKCLLFGVLVELSNDRSISENWVKLHNRQSTVDYHTMYRAHTRWMRAMSTVWSCGKYLNCAFNSIIFATKSQQVFGLILILWRNCYELKQSLIVRPSKKNAPCTNVRIELAFVSARLLDLACFIFSLFVSLCVFVCMCVHPPCLWWAAKLVKWQSKWWYSFRADFTNPSCTPLRFLDLKAPNHLKGKFI